MKKTYMIPSVEDMYFETVEMLAASIGVDYEEEGEEMEGRRRRGKWGDLWYEGEDE